MGADDIAGLCERLKTLWLELNDAHAKPPATARIMNALHQSGHTLERQAAEIERLRTGLEKVAAYYETGHRITEIARAALTGEDAATLGLSGKTQTDARTRGDA